MTLSKQTAIEVDKSSGFHVFEFHWATTGMSVFTVLLIVGMVALFILCFNWCQKRRRQLASYMTPFGLSRDQMLNLCLLYTSPSPRDS